MSTSSRCAPTRCQRPVYDNGATNGRDGEGGSFVELCRLMAQRLGLRDENLKILHQHLKRVAVDDALRFRAHIA